VKNRPKTVAFVTTCWDDWGGSEELWSRCAKMIRSEGNKVIAFKEKLPHQHIRYIDLSNEGVTLINIPPLLPQKLWRLAKSHLANYSYRWIALKNKPNFSDCAPVKYFGRQIKKYRPDIVVISQGVNFDGLGYAHACLVNNIRYALIAQKAADFYWPPTEDRPLMKKILMGADYCYFVSQHNLRLTEEQFGFRFTRSRVIFNPLKITQPLPYPSMDNGVTLGCVARLFIMDKGQDILLRILSKPFWKTKPLRVTFIGEGMDEIGLKEMAELLELKNIEFLGFQSDMEAVWTSCHALILPSRNEGLPLAIMEAMAAGRPVICTSAGGNAEIVEEGKTGFVSEANEKSLEDALLRAWKARTRWKQMGEHAVQVIRELVPEKAEEYIVNELLKS
jgi:glycosyltransferase involved in cell wall biosynthesis